MTALEDYVSDMFGVNTADLFGESKKRDIANARHVCMYMRNEFGRQSFAAIGRYFCKDHVTPIFACRVVNNFYKTEELFRSIVDQTINAWYGRTIYIPIPEKQQRLYYHEIKPVEALSPVGCEIPCRNNYKGLEGLIRANDAIH